MKAGHEPQVDTVGMTSEPMGWWAGCTHPTCLLTATSDKSPQHAVDRLEDEHVKYDQFLQSVYAETRAALRQPPPRPGMTGGF